MFLFKFKIKTEITQDRLNVP